MKLDPDVSRNSMKKIASLDNIVCKFGANKVVPLSEPMYIVLPLMYFFKQQ
jgi:hypothetical protein